MNAFLEDTLQADLELLKATEKANKAIIAYFNLLEHPYRGGPDFRFLYTTDQVKEAIAKCILLTVERVNPVYMYGPFGTGKSTIIRRLYSLLKRDQRFNVKFTDFSVVLFRPNFMLLSEGHPMKAQKNQWLLDPLLPPDIPWRAKNPGIPHGA